MHLEREANLLSLRHIFPPTQFPYPAADVQQRWATLLRDDTVAVAVAEDAVGLTAFVAFDTAGRLRYLGWVRSGRRATSEFPPHPIEIELARTG